MYEQQIFEEDEYKEEEISFLKEYVDFERNTVAHSFAKIARIKIKSFSTSDILCLENEKGVTVAEVLFRGNHLKVVVGKEISEIFKDCLYEHATIWERVFKTQALNEKSRKAFEEKLKELEKKSEET